MQNLHALLKYQQKSHSQGLLFMFTLYSTGVVVLGVHSAAYQVGPVVFLFLGHDAKMSSSIEMII